MPPFFEGTHYCEHLLVVHLIVALHIREALGHEGHRVELPIRLELREDCTRREVGGIALEFEAACVSGEGENWGGGDGVFEGAESAVFVRPPGPCLRLAGQ